MGMKIVEAPEELHEEIGDFFHTASMDDYSSICPPELASVDEKKFKRKEFIFIAEQGEEILGAIKFSVQGGVGQMGGIHVKPGLRPISTETIMRKLFEKFVEVCKQELCHAAVTWIPMEHKEALHTFTNYGFQEKLRAKGFWYKKDFSLMVKNF